MICRDRLIRLTQKVISIPSENPPGREAALAHFVEKDMRALGLDVKTVSYEKGRPNVIATWRGTLPRKEAARQAVLLTPHIDTVPVGTGWKHDPFGGEIHKGKLYGRGATDDKGNLAAAMEVMRSLVEDGFRPKKDIIMAATVDEETGSHCGIVPLVANKVLKPGLAVVLDSDECDVIIAQKGLIHMRVQIFGKKAHGAYNWQGVNAIEIASRVIQKLKAYAFPFDRHPLLRPPTVNIGVIRGGDKVNMVADFCEFAADVRYVPGMRPQHILSTVRSIVRSEAKRFKMIIDDLQLPYEMAPDHPSVAAYTRAAKACRCPVKIKGSEGATVITFFKRAGVPAFATGYGAKGTAHTTDEYLKVDTLYQGTCLLERFIKEYDAI